MNVIDAIQGRASCRAFLDRPVAPALITTLLDAARWAPSGANMQPWRVAVVTGAAKARIGAACVAARERGESERPDYRYYPEHWHEPYRGRRLACGMALYGALGIERGDHARRKEAWYRNYHFFGAPVGLVFLIHRDLAQGSWMDYGMFLQNVMLAARELGLDTCPQASLSEFPDLVRAVLGVEETWQVVCGMALGYGDRDAPVNRYRTERAPVDDFTSWHD